MKAGIDLFPKKIKAINKRQRLKYLALRGLVGLFVVSAGLLIGLSSYSLILAKQNKAIDTKIEATKNKIVELSDVESKQVYLLSKLGSFEELVKVQAKHQAVTETVFALLPSGTNLKGFQVSETGEIQLSGSLPDYPAFNELLARTRRTKDYRLPITKAVITKVGANNETAEVNFEMNLTMAVKE